MKTDKPSDQALNELKRYTENLLGFFDSKASVKISTNSKEEVLIEIRCNPLMDDQQVNRIALGRIILAWISVAHPDVKWEVNLSIKSNILIN